ncbi:sulfurtransferase TusA family protein [Brachybacterium sp. AOP43-C2-M15]|uniref:sulfurtransferase TusA family protein n=1 Tax=Brachybacterium sp. AOP43-C2-M15 TaxID=3457661 RepID=UPI004033F70F
MSTYTLETNGDVCPFPLIDAKNAMAQLQSGDDLVIGFDCTQATDSLPQWAAEDGHEVVAYDRVGDAGWTITVRKGA